ncbi:unnamed protein product [Somion occarium]|uniref:Uncharacterized protein n=1 Tax=Somion occarium TaxID=3059160 RepID=A0ABP1D7U1_9APHY
MYTTHQRLLPSAVSLDDFYATFIQVCGHPSGPPSLPCFSCFSAVPLLARLSVSEAKAVLHVLDFPTNVRQDTSRPQESTTRSSLKTVGDISGDTVAGGTLGRHSGATFLWRHPLATSLWACLACIFSSALVSWLWLWLTVDILVKVQAIIKRGSRVEYDIQYFGRYRVGQVSSLLCSGLLALSVFLSVCSPLVHRTEQSTKL